MIKNVTMYNIVYLFLTSEYMTYAAMDKFPFLCVQCNKR